MAAHHELPYATLESLLDRPETYAALVGEYTGPVSLGILIDEQTGESCLLLSVADLDAVRRRVLEVDGHMVRVIVKPEQRQHQPG